VKVGQIVPEIKRNRLDLNHDTGKVVEAKKSMPRCTGESSVAES
jgi:hypothetical protein